MFHSRRLRHPLLIFMLIHLASLVSPKPLIKATYQPFCDETYQNWSAVLKNYTIIIGPPDQTGTTKYLRIAGANNFDDCVKQCCLNQFNCDVVFFNQSSNTCLHIVCNLNSANNAVKNVDNQSSNQQCPRLKRDINQQTLVLQFRTPSSNQSDYLHHNELSPKQLIQEFGFLEDQSRPASLILKSKYSSGQQQTDSPQNGNQLNNLKVVVDENPILQLPNDSITIKAYVDPPSNEYVYKWTLVSKPNSPAQQDTGWMEQNTDTLKLNKLVKGQYIFKIAVSAPNKLSSGQTQVNITVLAPKRVNRPPAAIIQPNNSVVQLPKKEIVLDGSQSTDDDKIVSYQWEVKTFPIGYNPSSNDLQASTLQLKDPIPGTYVISLVVADADNQTSTATANLIVEREKDYPPTSNAGQDQIIFLPQNSVTLNGNESTDDKKIVSYEWSLAEDENNKPMDMSGVKTPFLHLSNLQVGVYKFILKVTDSSNQSHQSETHVFVKPTIDIKPEAIIDPPTQKIYMPLAQNLTLDGSKSKDVTGVLKYKWTQLSGPRQAVILNPNDSTTNVTGLVPGLFVFGIEVANAKNLTSNASTSVEVVQKTNVPPTAIITGGNRTIVCNTPCDIISLNASDSHDDLIDLKYSWTREPSSLAVGEVVDDSDKKPVLLLSNLIKGRYWWKLTVEDTQGAKDSELAFIDIKEPENIEDFAEVLLNVNYKNFKLEQENAVLKKLEILLSPNIDEIIRLTNIRLHPVFGSNFLLLRFTVRVVVNEKEVSLSATEVVKRLRIRLRNDKSLSEILSVRTAICQNDCSNHGECQEQDKTCKCDLFWMQNPLRIYLGDGLENCDFSVLYVLIFSLFAFCFLGMLLCCLFHRKPMHLKLIRPRGFRRVDLLGKKSRKPRSQKYTLLKQTTSNGFANKIDRHSSDESDSELEHRNKMKKLQHSSIETKIKIKNGSSKPNYKDSSSDSEIVEYDFNTIQSRRGCS